jgi:hypothetical protein
LAAGAANTAATAVETALTDESEEEKVEIFPGAPVGCEGHAMSL